VDKIFVQKGGADSILRELISICVLNEKRGKKRRDVNIAGVAPAEKSGPARKKKGKENRYIGRFRRYSTSADRQLALEIRVHSKTPRSPHLAYFAR
jgi:hypothetical protein